MAWHGSWWMTQQVPSISWSTSPFFLCKPYPFLQTSFTRKASLPLLQGSPLLLAFLGVDLFHLYEKCVVDDWLNAWGRVEIKGAPQLRSGRLMVPNSLPLQRPFWLTTRKPSPWRKARRSLWNVSFLKGSPPPCSGWPRPGSPFF